MRSQQLPHLCSLPFPTSCTCLLQLICSYGLCPCHTDCLAQDAWTVSDFMSCRHPCKHHSSAMLLTTNSFQRTKPFLCRALSSGFPSLASASSSLMMHCVFIAFSSRGQSKPHFPEHPLNKDVQSVFTAQAG